MINRMTSNQLTQHTVGECYYSEEERCFRRLLAATLKRAVEDLAGNALGDYWQKDLVQKEAERWFLSNERHYLFSFKRICTELDLSEEAILERLRAQNLLAQSCKLAA